MNPFQYKSDERYHQLQFQFSNPSPAYVGALGMLPSQGVPPPQVMQSLPAPSNSNGNGGSTPPFGGPDAHNNIGNLGSGGNSLFNQSTIYSSNTSRAAIEQQGAINMMSTASMVPRKIQHSLQSFNEQQNQLNGGAVVSSPRQHSSLNNFPGLLHQQHNQHLSQLQMYQLHPPGSNLTTLDQNNQGITSPTSTEEVIPLRKWIDKESSGGHQDLSPDNVQKQRGMMLRRTTVAYGIIKLIICARTSSHASTWYELKQACTIDNFVVCVIKGQGGQDDNIKGMRLINPASSLVFIKSSVSSYEDQDADGMGQYVQVVITPPPLANQATNPLESLMKEKSLIHSVGSLIHEVYTHGNPILLLYEFQKGRKGSNNEGPPSKRMKEEPLQMTATAARFNPFFPAWQGGIVEAATEQNAPHLSLLELGFSSSLSSLVDELLDCKCTLDVASKDLHLMLMDPCSFLVDRHFKPCPQGRGSLRIRKNKLYGRNSESSLITSTFCRVRSSGKSEALLIGGYSGSGKTRLVESVLNYLDDGVSSHVVTLKSDERSSSSVITQALDLLCVVIKEKSSEEECQRINARLVDAFADSSFLLELLPNAKLLYDAKRAKPSLHQGSEIQSNSASFILRLFMRAVSNKDRPVVLFLDDLQWCDNASLEIVHDIMSDTKSDLCVYFIGCFRDTECNSDHPIFKMMEAMNTSNVAIQLLGLGGVNRNELNCMTSDALCILPRHCKELSDILHTKTRGDPYFAIEMLKELVDQRLLQFNFQRRRWVWNEASIMYLDVTTNVLNLLKTKMMTMPKEIQAALKVCSCFSSVDSQIVVCLTESAGEYSNLRDELDRAVEEGFLDKVGDGGYKFVHDRVKEAAYGLIRETERNGFHYRVGMLMLSSSNVGDSLVQTMADQINRGGVTIQPGKDRIAVAELNYKAGTQAMTQSAFVKALSYFETAKNLLPTDHWKSQYYFSIRLFLSLSNAAFACGHGEMADEALESILREAKCLEDKLDAYYFKNNLLFHRGQANDAFSKCAEVLQELGETIPKEVDPRELVDMMEKVLHFFKSQRDDQLLHFKEIDNQIHFYLMQFYHQLSFFAYFGQTPSLQAFLSCRSVAIAIQCGFCKYSSIALASFASILCGKFKDVSNGYRIGSVALQLLSRFEATSLIPAVYLHFYGMVAHNKEPILDVSDKLLKGFQIGMSVGDSTIALMNGLHYVQKSFVGGRKLNVISKDIEYQLELCDTHGDRRTKRFMSLFNETICQVKAKTDISSTGEGAAEQDEVMKIEGFSEVILFHRIIQTFWLGYYDRCHYFAQKSANHREAAVGRLLKLIASFYHALAALHILRKKKSKTEMKDIARKALKSLHDASDLAPINFKNKVEFIEAEFHRVEVAFRRCKEEEMHAKRMYAKSIASAEAANLLHENALALEHAGHFCIEIGDGVTALRHFSEAKMKYEEWGSTVRASQMELAIAKAKYGS